MLICRPNWEVLTLTYNDVPVTPSVTGEIDVTGGDYTLALDDDGDGSTDQSVQPSEEICTPVYRAYLPMAMKGH